MISPWPGRLEKPWPRWLMKRLPLGPMVMPVGMLRPVAIGFHVPLLRVTTRPVFFAKKGGAPVLPVAVSRA